MDKIAQAMKRAGFPSSDGYDLPTSMKTFPDGAHYDAKLITRLLQETFPDQGVDEPGGSLRAFSYGLDQFRHRENRKT